nr:uncharacterized protein LOC110569142 [Aotus nancymaae]
MAAARFLPEAPRRNPRGRIRRAPSTWGRRQAQPRHLGLSLRRPATARCLSPAEALTAAYPRRPHRPREARNRRHSSQKNGLWGTRRCALPTMSGLRTLDRKASRLSCGLVRV